MAKFEVVSKGGSIGSHGAYVVGEFDTIEQAREKAKRMTKQLTPGEKKYYDMGYSVRQKKEGKAIDSAKRQRLHRALDAVMDSVKGRARDAGDKFEVVVGNLGVVYTGNSGFDAKTKYNTYVGQSRRNEGRAAGESVYLMKNGSPIQEHQGPVDDE